MLAAEFSGNLTLPFPIIVLRLAGAVLLCAVIGFEREAAHRSAGLRTHMLVGLAAATYALLTLISSISTRTGARRSAWIRCGWSRR